MKGSEKMIEITGGLTLIGTDSQVGFPTDLEGPAVELVIPSFFIAATTVTNAEFQQFVRATGYQTDSEKFGWSFVFHAFLSEDQQRRSQKMPGTNWWYAVVGASWCCPEGPGSSLVDRLDHPVVHVSRNDAVAYCQWSGMRLPTEAEWEKAARGGLVGKTYAWGDQLLDGEHHCNIWQGDFPLNNTLDDGFLGTAPVRTYEPNGYGLYQTAGNVWEWCANPRHLPLSEFQQSGQEMWQQHQGYSTAAFAIRGGSFLCHESYCNRYRVAARNGNTADSASNNMGFRCVRD
nr:formylglycine-generating enzyme family protein [uncultured Vagococcus sp.]